MIAGQTRGTPSVVQPRGRCALYIIHRTDLLTFPASDAFVRIHRKLLVGHHLPVEVFTDHVRVESGSGPLVELFDAPSALLDDMDDMRQLVARHIQFHRLLVLGVGLHKRQTHIALGHDHREHRFRLQRLAVTPPQVLVGCQVAIQDGHRLAHIVAASGQRPAEVIVNVQFQTPDECAHYSRHLPAVCGKAEADTFARVQDIAMTPFAYFVGDIVQLIVDSLRYLLCRPSRIARSAEIENHVLI